MPHMLRAAWQRWKLLAESLAHVQAKVLFVILYFLVVSPFAIALRLFKDPLALRAVSGSTWRTLSRQTVTLEDARKQF